MIRIAVCDDDIKFLDSFSRELCASFENAGQPVQISAYRDGKTLIEAIEKVKQIFDVVFLDVQMPAVDGFQTAARLRELSMGFILVFTTYMENQSREGYRYGAFRYIFKNNLAAELAEATPAILKKLGAAAEEGGEITLKCRTLGVFENLTLRKDDILFLKAEKTRRVTLRTALSEYELPGKPLSEYAKLLGESVFVPIMRNYLLNLNRVERIDADAFVLTGGLEVPLGVKQAVRKASLEKYLRFLEERME